MKTKTIYTCQKCDFQSPKWVGKCPECNTWNSFTEETYRKPSGTITESRHSLSAPSQISILEDYRASGKIESRVPTRFADLNLVLGGGFKIGSLVLLSGEPGIGKSTLTMQLCQDMAAKNQKVLYISGEESPEQIADRAQRLGVNSQNISILGETNMENILEHLHKAKPQLVVIDSIQVMHSAEIGALSGTINQIRFCTEQLMEYCKGNQVTGLIIGHVNKEGSLAGPKVLEHLVDTVLFLEGERYQNFRILRSLKNRFGSTNEISIMEMHEQGLREIENPSQIFLEGRKPNAIGSALTVTLEGSKPIILEVQALTNTTVFGYPKRTSSGFDLNRLQLLSAVIQKFLKINLSSQDIFANVVGGFRLSEPAADLSVAMAIISSFKKIPLPEKAIFLGEVGLSGELRSIGKLAQRVKEAEKLGFDTIITARSSEKINSGKIKIIQVQDLEQAAKLFLS